MTDKNELRQLFLEKIHAEQQTPVAQHARAMYVSGAGLLPAPPSTNRPSTNRPPVRNPSVRNTRGVAGVSSVESVESMEAELAQLRRDFAPSTDEMRFKRMQAMRGGGATPDATDVGDEQLERLRAMRRKGPTGGYTTHLLPWGFAGYQKPDEEE